MEFHSQVIFRSPLHSAFEKTFGAAFSEALYLSSPGLFIEHQKYLNGEKKDPKDLHKLKISLYKYQSRATFRCTPFGLFAGVSIGRWGKENKIVFDQDLANVLNRKTRLDMNVLCSLAQELSKENAIKPYLRFYPNTSIYLVGSSYRYIEYYYLKNRRVHQINKVDHNIYLDKIIERSKGGLTISQLVELIKEDEITEEEAQDFINALIDSQLIVSELEPSLTGEDYFDRILKTLTDVYSKADDERLKYFIAVLEEVRQIIKTIDASLYNSIELYKTIHDKLLAILPAVSETNLFQTDLFKLPESKSLDVQIQQKLKRAAGFFNKINPPLHNQNLEAFKKRFSERYEDNEVPLLTALDAEAGVGYPAKDNHGVNSLAEGIFAKNKGDESDLKWNGLQQCLLKLLKNGIKDNKREISISEADFPGLNFSGDTMPPTYSIVFKVINAATNKLQITLMGGSSAINLLGRFTGSNAGLEALANDIANFEKDQVPDKIIAEIVHLPESRTGNILSRAKFRDHEIPFLARSAVSFENQIRLENLLVSVKNNRVILSDKMLGKEIIPRIGNAHNFSMNSLAIYHFLGDLQTQYFSKYLLNFSWGVLAGQFDFLPRVEFEGSVISPAKWQLRENDLAPFKDKKKDADEKNASFFKLKEQLQLPEKFIISEGDNELLIDCSEPVAIEVFIDIVKKAAEITLEEYLFDNDHSLICDTAGNSFSNECIAIALNKQGSETVKYAAPRSISSGAKQIFSIGSEWLYFKIYCGPKTADLILTEKLNELTKHFLLEKIIDKWFFIRYIDTDYHLRFRLHITDIDKYGYILQAINKELEPLIEQHLISKIQTDTYRRELNRYGDNSIAQVETLFYNDSVFVTDMLSMLDAGDGETIRWQVAIRSVDELLNDFGFSTEEKQTLISRLNEAFFIEHGGDKALKLTLDEKFRALRPVIEETFNIADDQRKEYFPIIALLHARSLGNKKIIEQLLEMQNMNQLQITLPDLLSSLLHMNLDRLFMGRNRTNEFVVYNLLSRYYKTSLAREKKTGNKNHIHEINI